jgi:hypothetical protein
VLVCYALAKELKEKRHKRKKKEKVGKKETRKSPIKRSIRCCSVIYDLSQCLLAALLLIPILI